MGCHCLPQDSDDHSLEHKHTGHAKSTCYYGCRISNAGAGLLRSKSGPLSIDLLRAL